MLQYVNGFSFATDEKKEEFIINFLQAVPQIDINGVSNEVKNEVVSSIVMRKVVAENLCEILKQVIENQNEPKI